MYLLLTTIVSFIRLYVGQESAFWKVKVE